MSWLIKHLPPGCQLHMALYGEDAPWDVNTHLTAVVIDVLEAANWQRAGKKDLPKPKPFKRPDPLGRVQRQEMNERLKAAKARHEARMARQRAKRGE